MFFFFNDTATTEIYTLSLHDALPISATDGIPPDDFVGCRIDDCENVLVLQIHVHLARDRIVLRSEEHTSELQSRLHLVCRLLLEKKKTRHTLLVYLITQL